MDSCEIVENLIEESSLEPRGIQCRGMKKKILIIDDTDAIREIIRETLNTYGFEALDTESGERGIQLAKEEQPDLILCDVNMPHMDGYGTLSLLKKESRTASIPFVFLTGASDRNFHRKGMELGADDYLTKPFTSSELLAAVNTRLEKQEKIKRTQREQLEELCGKIRVVLPHELYTPLNGIIGLSSMLQEDYDSISREQLLEFAVSINKSAMRLHRLIENFLVCAQLDLAAHDPTRLEILRNSPVIEIRNMIQEVGKHLAETYSRESDISFDLQVSHAPAPADYFKKVVEEIVDNAFKFSESGTPVHVETSSENSHLCLAVTNHGRGMTRDQISRIGMHMQFERHIHEQQGTGLGLVIAKKLSELVDGELVVDSVPGKATQVRIYLPKRSVEESRQVDESE